MLVYFIGLLHWHGCIGVEGGRKYEVLQEGMAPMHVPHLHASLHATGIRGITSYRTGLATSLDTTPCQTSR